MREHFFNSNSAKSNLLVVILLSIRQHHPQQAISSVFVRGTKNAHKAGAEIAIVYRSSRSGGEAAAAQISEKHGVRAIAYQADVADSAAIEAAITGIVGDFGHLDIVIANAGICTEVDALDFTPKQFRELMGVNLDGAFYTAQAAAKVFKSQASGNIVFTTSMSAIVVNRPESQAAYNASKAGVVQLAKSLAIEWIGFCRVNCISPGYIATDMLADAPEEQRNAWLAVSLRMFYLCIVRE